MLVRYLSKTSQPYGQIFNKIEPKKNHVFELKHCGVSLIVSNS